MATNFWEMLAAQEQAQSDALGFGGVVPEPGAPVGPPINMTGLLSDPTQPEPGLGDVAIAPVAKGTAMIPQFIRFLSRIGAGDDAAAGATQEPVPFTPKPQTVNKPRVRYDA